MLFIDSAIITIDAIGTQKKIAEKIINSNADYVFILKDNQKLLKKDVKDYFEEALKGFYGEKYSTHKTYDRGHGRTEKREYYMSDDIDWLTCKDEWLGLASIGMVKRTVLEGEKVTEEIQYYITSLKTPEDNCELFAKCIRRHWGVESYHWILDVAFK